MRTPIRLLALRSTVALLAVMISACASSNRFVGKWYGPTDKSYYVIDSSTVHASSEDGKQNVILKYVLQSPRHLVMMNGNGQAVISCELSEDGNSFQGESEAPFGTGTFIVERVK